MTSATTTEQAVGRLPAPPSSSSRRVIDRLQKSLINPPDKLAFALRIPPPGDALLETTGQH